MTDYNVNVIYGYSRLVTTYKFEGNRMYMGGYAIHYDQNGIETGRTENTWNGSIGYDPPIIRKPFINALLISVLLWVVARLGG